MARCRARRRTLGYCVTSEVLSILGLVRLTSGKVAWGRPVNGDFEPIRAMAHLSLCANGSSGSIFAGSRDGPNEHHMPQLRFQTSRDLFEAFPSARQLLMLEPSDRSSLGFLHSLTESSVEKAVGFCAYLLPRREAVWWACETVKTLSAPATKDEQRALAAAEQWVKDPEEEVRLATLKLGQAGNHEHAATWLALAAGWAGGSMPFEGKSVTIPPDQTAKAVRAAILIAGAYCDPKNRAELLQQCVRKGAALAAADQKE